MRQMRKKIILAIIVTFILCAIIAGGLGYYIVSGKNKTITDLQAKAASSFALAFARDLPANSTIKPNDIIEISIKDSSFASGGYYKKSASGKLQHYLIVKNDVGADKVSTTDIKKEDLYGRVIRDNVSKNTPILDSLLYAPNEEPAIDERLEEFNFIAIPSDLVETDYVDVRITFPDGEDYSVLVGKKVESYAGNSTFFMKLNEADIMNMSCAMVEAYMQKGVKLYANKYVDAAHQLFKETIEDYVKKYEEGIKTAIQKGNELEARKVVAGSKETYLDNNDNPVTIYTEAIDGEAVATEECYLLINDKTREELEKEYGKSTEETIKDEDIAKYAGIKLEYVKEIKEALLDETANEVTLTYFRNMRVQNRTEIESTYPVREEVLRVVKSNPNLVETIRAEFDKKATVIEKYDRYKQLEKEYELAPDTESSGYGYGGTSDGKVRTKAVIKEEMEELLKERTENIQKALEKEYDEQKIRRVAYLEELVKQNSGKSTSSSTGK